MYMAYAQLLRTQINPCNTRMPINKRWSKKAATGNTMYIKHPARLERPNTSLVPKRRARTPPGIWVTQCNQKKEPSIAPCCFAFQGNP